MQPLLTSEQAAAILQLNPKYLERLAAKGEVPGLKLGKFWRYRQADLEAWIEKKSTAMICGEGRRNNE